MAGAGQPFYMPLTWPIGHIHSAITRPKKEEVSAPSATPDLDLIGHLTSMVGATRSFGMALLCIYVAYDGTSDLPNPIPELLFPNKPSGGFRGSPPDVPFPVGRSQGNAPNATMPERSKGAVLSTAASSFVGSNPTRSICD